MKLVELKSNQWNSNPSVELGEFHWVGSDFHFHTSCIYSLETAPRTGPSLKLRGHPAKGFRELPACYTNELASNVCGRRLVTSLVACLGCVTSSALTPYQRSNFFESESSNSRPSRLVQPYTVTLDGYLLKLKGCMAHKIYSTSRWLLQLQARKDELKMTVVTGQSRCK